MVYYDPNGESGNVFFILGSAYSVLLKQDRRDDAQEMNDRVMASESYEDALRIIGEYVTLVRQE